MKTPNRVLTCLVIASTAAVATADIREEYAKHDMRSDTHSEKSPGHQNEARRESSLRLDTRAAISLGDREYRHGRSTHDLETDDRPAGRDNGEKSSSRIFGEILAGRPETRPIILGRSDGQTRSHGVDSKRDSGLYDNERHNRSEKDFDASHWEYPAPSIRFIPAPGGLPLAGFGLFLAVGRRARRSRA